MLKFVVVVHGGPIGAATERYLNAPDVTELPFTPRRHWYWHDAGSSVHVAGWEHGETASSVIDNAGVVALAGTPRPAVGDWAGVSATTAMRDTVRRTGFTPDDLVDAHAVVRADADGTGVVFADPIGLHPLYRADDDGTVVVGNRADLVAETMARVRGVAVSRDLACAVWLSFAGYPIGSDTGFEGVRLVEPGAILEIADFRVRSSTRAPLYERSSEDPMADADAVADLLYEDVRAGLRFAAERSRATPDLEVTGGKDSRALCAVAAGAGLLESFRLVTYGPDGLADKSVARTVADALGAEHHDISDLHYLGAVQVPVLERFRRHVHRSAGMAFCGDANEPRPHRGLTISGLLGELFRTPNERLASHPVVDVADAEERFRVGRRLGSAGLLRPDVAGELLDVATQEHLEPWTKIASPNELRGSWFLRYSLRRWQVAMVDLQEELVRPYYSSRCLRAAFGLGHRARTDELVHRRLVERGAPQLLTLPFADDRWRLDPPEGPAPLSNNMSADAKWSRPGAGTSAEASSVSWVIEETPDSPLYDVVDRDAMRGAAAEFDRLGPHERRQVLGAATGLIWLDHLELPSRVAAPAEG